jgi:hypothetical protein
MPFYPRVVVNVSGGLLCWFTPKLAHPCAGIAPRMNWLSLTSNALNVTCPLVNGYATPAIKVSSQKFNVGLAHKRCWVQLTYLEDATFQVSCPPNDTVLKTIHVKGLTVSDITGISESV